MAVLMVLGNHASICPRPVSLFLNRLTTVWDRGGWTGVDLFFVLSGFLVSGLLFNEHQRRGNIDVKRFLIRRGLKIYPAFWLLLAITLLVTIAIHETPYRGGYLSELLFLQNYHPSIWDHTWSLAVEEHFYVFLSLLFLILVVTSRKNPQRAFAWIPACFAVIAVACLITRYVAMTNATVDYVHNIQPTHLRIDSLFFGVLLSYLWNVRGLSERRLLPASRYLLGGIGIACFLPAFLVELSPGSWLWTIGLTVFYLGGGCLLLAMLKMEIKPNSFLEWLAKLGKYSYSIYLWNGPVSTWLTRFTTLAEDHWLLYTLVFWAGTLVVGIGTARLIEYPILRLRDRLLPSSTPALRTPGSSRGFASRAQEPSTSAAMSGITIAASDSMI